MAVCPRFCRADPVDVRSEDDPRFRSRRLFMTYEFLVETYETERVKVVSVWSEFCDDDLPMRPRADDRRGRSVLEQMVHQCVSEDLWFRTMLGIDVGAPPLPAHETRLRSAEHTSELQSRQYIV